ncbi:hypothetical protein K439DRAFT_1629523 [Ramaria rubella]|nr:hypothetical protein K439DRAFT_1629523 [Ramaria rubella]
MSRSSSNASDYSFLFLLAMHSALDGILTFIILLFFQCYDFLHWNQGGGKEEWRSMQNIMRRQ